MGQLTSSLTKLLTKDETFDRYHFTVNKKPENIGSQANKN